jgi:hypothetical protein
MARPRKTGGTVYPREGTAFWWITYRARDGHRVTESSGTTNREEAERFLRERLAARDEGRAARHSYQQESYLGRMDGLVFGKAI